MASRKNNRANNHKSKRKITAGVRGEARKDHFESGGSLSGWRGTSAVHRSRSEKRKDRRVIRQNAIKESMEE